MWNPQQYQLLDFGQGRKLEAFSGVVIDRPCPAADLVSKSAPDIWKSASLSYAPSIADQWVGEQPPSTWQVEHQSVTWQLKPTPFGHVGVFPEQILHWPWLAEVAEGSSAPFNRVLHLFAYTGGTSLHLARQGWQVVHVDASKPAVQWARHNAEQSSLDHLPIRWIVEDAVLFVERELRRGNRYEMILLDPPAFGHGPKGQRWELTHQIEDFLTDCCQLLSEHAKGILLTGHSDDEAPERWMWRALERANQDQRTDSLQYLRSELFDEESRPLDFGYSVRWRAKSPDL